MSAKSSQYLSMQDSSDNKFFFQTGKRKVEEKEERRREINIWRNEADR